MSIRHNPIAYVALFIALGGTSYAATALPAGSVGTKQLQRGAVTAAKIAPGVLPKPVVVRSQLRSSGPNGFPGTRFNAIARCPRSTTAVGGGYKITGNVLNTRPVVVESRPTRQGWMVIVEVTQGSGIPLPIAYAVCQ